MLTAEVVDGVAILRIDRPERRNALSSGLLDELDAACAAVDRGQLEASVVVITGVDPTFCAGLDLHELTTGALSLKRQFFSGLRQMTAVSIAAVNGPAVTGGLELALACDIRIASERATFADTHARVGLVPGAGMTVALPRLVGSGRARLMSFTGRPIDAAHAEMWGLVDEVVPHGELMGRVLAAAADIRSMDQIALRRVRDTLDRTEGLAADQALRIERREFDTFVGEWDESQISALAARVRSAKVPPQS